MLSRNFYFLHTINAAKLRCAIIGVTCVYFRVSCSKCRHVPSVHRASTETLYSAGILKPIFTGTPQTANTDTGLFVANLAENPRSRGRGSGVLCGLLFLVRMFDISTHVNTHFRYIIHKSSTIYCLPSIVSTHHG